MADYDNVLDETLKRYKEKKQNCLNFITRAKDLAEAYEKEFSTQKALPAKNAQTEDAAPISDTLANIYQRIENAKLKILIAGQFKHGKSTLINALLGEDVLPAYSTPCTAVITEIEYGEKKKAVLTFKKEITDVPPGISAKVREHIGSRKKDIPDLTIESERLGTELEDYLVIPEDETKEQRESVAESPYASCRLSWPLELCRNDVVLIDSPGLNEATARDETTTKYVPQADMILHVLNANQLYGKPDKEFVEKLAKYGNPPLLFIVNRFDQLNTQRDKDRVRERAMKELPTLTPYGDNGIFFMSAYKAFCGRIENDADALKESGYLQFEKRLADIIERDRGKIKLAGGVTTACHDLQELITNYIPELRRKLDANGEELENTFRSKANEFEKLDAKKERICRDLESRIKVIKDRLKTELKIFISDFSVEDAVEAAPIELSFFNNKESQKQAVRRLSEAMLGSLQAQYENFIKMQLERIQLEMHDLQESLQEQMDEFNELLSSLRLDLDMNAQDSGFALTCNLDDISFSEIMPEVVGAAAIAGGAGAGAVFLASRFIALLGGPIGWGITIVTTLGAVLLAIFNSSAMENKLREEFIKAAQKKIREDKDNWAKELANEIGKGLDMQKDAFMSSLQQKIDATKTPIEQAIALLKNNKGDLAEKKQHLDQFRSAFAKVLNDGQAILTQL